MTNKQANFIFILRTNILLTLIVTCIEITAQAQNNVEILNDSIDGHHELRYANGRKQIELDVINGKVNGQVTRYFKSGKVRDTRDIVNNKYSGTVKVYDKKGRIGFYQTTRNDTLISEVDSGFCFLDGHLRARWFWSRESDKNLDKLSKKNKDPFDRFWNYYGYVPAINGVTTIYYKSGEVKKVKPRTDGKRNGEWKWFNRNGVITKSITYEMGKRMN
jgi:antitoxin component YwqK of YwqJK toxin-antitoxin module